MNISRRGFIASIAAAVTGAAILPELIPIPPSPVKHAPGSLTLAALQEAYMSCQYGGDEPDLIWVSPQTYSEIVSRIEVMQRFTQKHDSGVTGLCFNGAIISASQYMRDDQLWVTNSKNPLNPHLNQLIELT